MGAIAKSMAEGVENQMALGLGDRPAHQFALGLGTVVARVAAADCRALQHDRLRPDFVALGQQHGAMDAVFQLADVALPCVRAQLGQGRLAQRTHWHTVGSGVLGGEVRCRAGARATPAGAG